MQNLIKHWPSCKENLQGKPIALFLDFDGTLSPIAPTPDQAELPEENRMLLQELSNHKGCKVTVVSGRSIENLKDKLKINNINQVYAGNHGLEIHGLRIHFENLLPLNIKYSLQKINDELMHFISPVQGVIVENKKLSLSIHYRLVDEKDILSIKKVLINICEPYRRNGEIQIRFGKKVLEVRPCIKWNKGHAVSWLLKIELAVDPSITPIYIGDDETDEDAFAMFKDAGLTVVVGQQPSQARYYVKDSPRVTWILKEILQLLDATEHNTPVDYLQENSSLRSSRLL